jgi:hypothetical protein
MVVELDGWRFSDLPEPVGLDLYRRAREEFCEYFARVEGVHAIYRYGSVTYPGLSDLDFMVVLNDDYQHRPGVEYSNPRFSTEAKYAVHHQQFFISRHLFPTHNLLIPIFEIEHVWGAPCGEPVTGEEELHLASLFLACEDVVTVFPEFLLSCLTSRQVRARYGQAQLKLITKISGLAETLLNRELPGAAEFAGHVTELREHWFSRSAEENCQMLRRGIEEATDFIATVAKGLSEYVMQMGLLPHSVTEVSRWAYHCGSFGIDFERPDQGFSFHSSGVLRRPRVRAPMGLMLPLVWFASGRGPLSEYIRDHFEQKLPCEDLAKNSGAQKIVTAKNGHCEFLIQAGITIHIFGYYGYHTDYSRGVRTLMRLAARNVFRR